MTLPGVTGDGSGRTLSGSIVADRLLLASSIYTRGSQSQRLIIAIRQIGRGHLAYQPVIFEGQLPGDEKSAGILFALAAKHPDPIPTVGEREVCRWRFVLESLRSPVRRQLASQLPGRAARGRGL
jgi:hypothetical protein